tara:strand:- start:131 stop:1012 length:882 start_codon:yes stop_codon:yes gene_type:complete
MNKEKYLIGHSYLLNLLIDNFKMNLSHALLFNGIKGIGKCTTAIKFIDLVQGQNTNHIQNFFHINAEDNPAMIEDIRNLIKQVNLTNSNRNQKSFVILDNANLLNSNSFNALLKTIEEPPNNTIIIIISHNLKQIPKTIISRCVKLDFKPLNQIHMIEYCKKKQINFDESDIKKFWGIIGGSIEKLLLLTEQGGLNVKNELDKLIETNSIDFSKFEKFYDYISNDYKKYFKLIIDSLYMNQKQNFIRCFHDKKLSMKVLSFFKNIKMLSAKELNNDKKKELYFILTEYLEIKK